MLWQWQDKDSCPLIFYKKMFWCCHDLHFNMQAKFRNKNYIVSNKVQILVLDMFKIRKIIARYLTFIKYMTWVPIQNCLPFGFGWNPAILMSKPHLSCTWIIFYLMSLYKRTAQIEMKRTIVPLWFIFYQCCDGTISQLPNLEVYKVI